MKKLIAAIIACVFVVVGISVAANVLIDQAALRARVAVALQQETGLNLTVEQSAIQFLPWPSIVARNVVLSRPGEEAFFQAHSLHAGLSVLALLQREVRFQDFVVDGAQIVLHRRADGRTDWMVRAPKGAEEEAPLPMNGFASKRIEAHWAVALDALHMTNSTVRWDDQRLGWRGGFAVQTLDLAGLRTPSPWVNIQGQHAGTMFTLKGHVGSLGVFGAHAPGAAAPWAFSLAGTLGPDSHRDWMEVDGVMNDPRHLQGLTTHIRGEWQDVHDAQLLFPHAGLPSVTALGGDITVCGGLDLSQWRTDPSKAGALSQGWWPVPGLTVSAVHMHAGHALVRGVGLGHITLAADSAQVPLSVESDIEWRGSDWHLSGQAGTLAGIMAFLQRHGQGDAVAVQAELRSQSLSLSDAFGTSNTPAVNAQDALVLTMKGTMGLTSKMTMQAHADQLHLPTNVLHNVTFSGAFSHDGKGVYALNGFDFESQETALTGDIHAAWVPGGVPRFTGAVASKHMDIDALLNGAASVPDATVNKAVVPPQVLLAQKVAAPAAETTAQQHADNPSEVAPKAVPQWIAALRQQDVDAQVQLDQLHVGGVDYTGLSGHVVLNGGHAVLDGLKGQGLGVTLGGVVDVDASATPVRLHVQAGSFVMPAEWVQNVVAMPDVFQGAVQLVGDVTGQGSDVESVRNTVAGDVGLSLVNGRVSGAVLGQLAGPQAASFIGSGKHDLRCLAVHMVMSPGQAAVDTFGLQAGNIEVSGHGQIGVMDHTLSMSLRPSLHLAGAEASTPVLLEGPWEHLTVQSERDANGSAQLTLGGTSAGQDDPCVAWLAAARDNQPGPLPTAAVQKHHGAGDLLKALGVWH